MIDEHSDVEVYVPLKVVNGKLKKDGSYLFFSKEMGNGDIVYYAYNSVSDTLGHVDNIMRFLMSCKVVKLAKLTPNQKLGCITALGKTLNQNNDQNSLKNYKNIISRSRHIVL